MKKTEKNSGLREERQKYCRAENTRGKTGRSERRSLNPVSPAVEARFHGAGSVFRKIS